MKLQIMNFVTMKICFIKPGHYSTFLNKYCELQKVSAEALPMVLTSNHKSQCSCKWPNDELLDLLSIPSIFTVFTVSLVTVFAVYCTKLITFLFQNLLINSYN